MANKRQIFGEPSEEDEENPTVAYLGGMTQGGYSFWDLAQAFKTTGDILLEQVISGKFEAYELVLPALYNYRHSLELYLKYFVYEEGTETHSLGALLKKFELYIEAHHKIKVPDEFRRLVLEIHDFDKNAVTFRYPEKVKSKSTGDIGEFRIDLFDVRSKMDTFQKSFHKVMLAAPDFHER